ncbi:bifunctional adenosylcobinamide kinase/adenosylcobinamide-phosphate guanylyltransferase [Paraglaciecola chathamensis]|uniref:Bifunctional adenosylcobalamin biosynthesis protein n=1 Tax=Paraglaciecola chathamensis TaxID=368405 RepID=A0ABS0W8E0_9ALTE|nr:bifunctional adenosylcobinamide kinase/adenosylcobinamide-phosphate guanylyltransferase [Paraglaciecola chathamensis]MBJ2135032.1 bifunctional adenosylcobinamide kinase/adenosylcobinamide-phosphate guanylyltransferase [Paraglaciecola chathamensis]
MLHFIIGGARSGKSNYALEQALALSQQSGKNVTYVATATATDAEMAKRIARHQQERPAHWSLAEVPLNLTEYIEQYSNEKRVADSEPPILVIDCLTLWLNNHLYHQPEQDFSMLFQGVTQAIRASKASIIMVANEVGLGIIPMGEVTRQFVDQAGWLNQAVASNADHVTFVAAGLPMALKRP